MKKHNLQTGVILLGLAMLLVLAPIITPRNTDIVLASPETQITNIITANGEGSVKVTPDIAYITVGVTSENEDLSIAQKDAKENMVKVMGALNKYKIDEKDVQTTNYNVNPKYNWDEKSQVSKIIGYTVSNQVQVKIRDISKLGEILDSVVASGSNNVGNIRFAVENETELYNQALELATKDAKQKALAMGKEFNITNIRPARISEISNRNTPYMAVKSEALMDSVSRNSTPINTGSLEIVANVSIEFKY